MCLSLKVKVIESQVGQVKGHRSKSALFDTLSIFYLLYVSAQWISILLTNFKMRLFL